MLRVETIKHHTHATTTDHASYIFIVVPQRLEHLITAKSKVSIPVGESSCKPDDFWFTRWRSMHIYKFNTKLTHLPIYIYNFNIFYRTLNNEIFTFFWSDSISNAASKALHGNAFSVASLAEWIQRDEGNLKGFVSFKFLL